MYVYTSNVISKLFIQCRNKNTKNSRTLYKLVIKFNVNFYYVPVNININDIYNIYL